MQRLAVIIGFGYVVTQNVATSLMLSANNTQLRGHCGKPQRLTSYGKDGCRCIGIDNMKGFYAAQVDYHHVQYPLEAGASCGAWESGTHPKCKETPPPKWCNQEWCYVDPCSCNLEVLPKQTVTTVTYQGQTAYWSYVTCGFTDFWSEEDPDACVNQKTKGACDKHSDCAWDGKQCGGKEVVQTCKETSKNDESIHGQDDCRCVGLSGRDVGHAFMHINDEEIVRYPPNVGGTCDTWEMYAHPDCKKDGGKPSWCSQKWCIVDPCSCKTKTPPRTVMPANAYMRFQGKTAYWSYETCGSADTWSTSHEEHYCVSQKTEAACKKLKDKCTWNGKECLGKALVEICEKQEASGALGVEAPLEDESATLSLKPSMALMFALAAYLLR